MLANFVFKRKNLVDAYCDSLAGRGIANARSGLFLAGPRRVGKSTFLIEDLMPEAKRREWLSVYVDLWANKLVDPASLITEAIKNKLTTLKSKLTQLAEQVQLQKINVLKTIELDFSKPGLPQNITLSDLLADLVQLSQKPVLLIIDEAQHALSTPDGMNTMFALKSARDQINRTARAPNLMLVFTGSNRDKLAQLVIKKDQPFFGSDVTAFPLLGRAYTDFLTEQVNQALVASNQFSQDSVWDAFQLTGHRPEILRQLIGQTAISHEAPSFSDLLKEDAYRWQTRIWESFEHDFDTLPPLHQAILTLLIKQERTWSPFSETSMQYYQQATNQMTIPVSSVQTAIQSLRSQGVIWQSSRGTYALEDESFAKWFKRTHLIFKHTQADSN